MERLRELRALLKRWEAEFVRERRRKPGQADIAAAPEDTRRLYKEYRMLKQQGVQSDPAQPSPSGQSAAPEPPATEQVPDSGCWGSHLNRQPKAPRQSRRVPEASVQYYGMKLKSKLGAAGKETPLTPRRTPAPRKSPLVPKLRKDQGPTAAPMEPFLREEAKAEDLLLPRSVAGLAPLILAAGSKPSQAPQARKRFQELKETLAQTLGSLDPAWLQRCQGAPMGEETKPGPTQKEEEQGEGVCAPPKQEEGGGDSNRKRPRGAEEGQEAPAKLRRCHRGSAKGAVGAGNGGRKEKKKSEEEEEEEKEEQEELRKVMEPLENLLGEVEEEEEEKPRCTRKVIAARAFPRSRGNFVRLNLRSRSHVRGFALRGHRLRKQMWKQKWQKKAGWFGGGGSMDRSSDVCFRCGGTGHWASACRGAAREVEKSGPAPEEEEEEEEAPLPTLEEVARRTNTFCPELCAESGGSNVGRSNGILEASAPRDGWRPAYEPPAPPAPMEPLYSLGAEGKVRETPKEVLEALRALGYSSFRPGQEVAIMRILSGMGKSLCYQLPAYLYHQRSKCITLVISPLVSLMDDQVSGLPRCLKAVCIHSNMPKSQREAAMEKVMKGEVQILLLSPEALVGGGGSGGGFLPSADRLPPVAFACIDEAHCVSEWSHNFRPCYLRLCKVLRDRLGVRCFLGLTATATLATARDVVQHLGIPPEEGITVHSAAVPPNLLLSVSMDRNRDEALISLLRGERFGSLDSIIVYCTRREETARIAALIRTCLQGVPLRERPRAQDPAPGRKAKAKRSLHARCSVALADSYHAGLSAAERRRVQSRFMSGQLRVVVATVAFGMGLDKADVRGVIHYNMPKSLEGYVQEIGRAGRDGAAAHCHLFLDAEGGDLPELRRHIYGDSVDFVTVKRLVRKVFVPCKCRELHRQHREATEAAEVEDAELAELLQEEVGEEESGTRQSRPRVCHKHERAIPIQATVEALDLREEAIETLLCYLELHPRRWLELLPPTYSSCRLQCYGGPRQLRDVARSSPPVAVVLARERLEGKEHVQSSSVAFDVVSLSDSMGWEVVLVKRALRQLQWEPRLRRDGGRSAGKSGVLVEFGDLSFHLRAYGDLSDEELDSVCDFLHQRVVAREKMALGQLRACFQTFQSVAFQTYGPHPVDEEERRSARLKALLSDYFEKERLERGREEEEEDEGLDGAKLRDWESQIRADIRHFLDIRRDEKFTGRAVARIFHGIGSPCFPAQIYGRDRRFWRRYLCVDFHQLARMATEEILATR